MHVFIAACLKVDSFMVGDKENSWSSRPPSSDSLSRWAEKNRFNVGDFLILQLTKEEYESCNQSNPIKEYKDTKTEVELDRPGPFYFISKAGGSYEKGQKICHQTVVVHALGLRGGFGVLVGIILVSLVEMWLIFERRV
ncbi:early nodulin-like protein 14 [Alnus glutinosa]|uniref:early nodulin-like protein 14 n=1 Tax=Alnus glutinosa TaxID=3517 RepID=UPI002D79A1A8|nr:early nodulin-like protein 14 [Alnus glutinosa]